MGGRCTTSSVSWRERSLPFLTIPALICLTLAQEFDAAIKLSNEMLKAYPASLHARYWRGAARLLQRDWRGALTDFAVLAEADIDPHDDDGAALRMGALVYSARAFLALGSVAEAREVAQEATRSAPHHGPAWLVLMRAEGAGGDWAQALKAADEVMKWSSPEPAFLLERARLLLLLGRPQEAAQALRPLTLEGGVDAHVALIQALLAGGDAKAALRAAKEGVAAHETAAPLYRLRAEAERRLGQTKEAQEDEAMAAFLRPGGHV